MIIPINCNYKTLIIIAGMLWGSLAKSPATSLSFKRTPDGRSMTIGNPHCIAIQKRLTEDDPCDGEVLSVDWAVRAAGYKGSMKYKPDLFR